MFKFLLGIILGMYICEEYGYTHTKLLDSIEKLMRKKSEDN